MGGGYGVIGRKFTWFRGRSCSKLDRTLVEIEWLEEFRNLKVWGIT